MNSLNKIEEKVLNNERLTREDGIFLFKSNDLARIGYLADIVRKRISGDYVYYNVNCHLNLTNVCTALCDFCAFGCEKNSEKAYEMTMEEIRKKVEKAAKDPRMKNLHIVSGLHPDWPFEYYVNVIKMLKREFPHLHLKGFTGVEITHFAKISGKSIKEVLEILKEAGIEAMPGGGAEILNDRIRNILCPNKATAKQWLEVSKTAHQIGIKTNASMLYGHIETLEERVDHLITIRDLQDETKGIQTFISFPFHPNNTELGKKIKRTSVWDDLKTMAISRLMLDNIHNIKAYWVMLTLPIAQIALGFGANDIDGTISEEKIMHDAGANSPKFMSRDNLIDLIKKTGRIPCECDINFNIINEL